MTKKIALQESEYSNSIKQYFAKKDVEFVDIETLDADLIVYDDYTGEIMPDNAINVHPSLLPSFDGDNAIEKAFVAGVKVSGVTVHSNKNIIAQYPVLIGVDTHIDEYIKDIIDIEKRLVPVVIESIIEDRVFDFHDIFKGPCSHKSGGCSGNCNSCH